MIWKWFSQSIKKPNKFLIIQRLEYVLLVYVIFIHSSGSHKYSTSCTNLCSSVRLRGSQTKIFNLINHHNLM